MKKRFFIIFIIFVSFFSSNSCLAEKKVEINKKNVEKTTELKQENNDDNKNINIDKIKLEIQKLNSIKKKYFLKENISFDLKNTSKKLKNLTDGKYVMKWEAPGKKEVYGPVFNLSFENFGEKEIKLSIINKETKKVKVTKKIKIFIYKKIIPFVFSKEIPKDNIEQFISFYKKLGILIYNIGRFGNDELKNNSLLEKIYELDKYKGPKADYIGIWGGKDFIFDIFSKIDLEKKIKKDDHEYNFLAISSFNIKLLDNYLNNFIANKPWLKMVLIGDKKIANNLDKELELKKLKIFFIKNGYKEDFQDVRLNNSGINKFLFISNFINNLSNKGFDTNSIYIFILIPFLLTLIGFIKHFIGFSPLGITIPLFLTILFFKFGALAITLFFFLFIFFNVILALFFSKYILLYTPKISMLLIINIVIFILVFNILSDYNLINFSLDNILYLLIFVIISERIISIILSKEFQEYKSGIFNTYFISLILFLFFVIPQIKILILAFPEVILALIPINFLIGKFTGLRITEYFRFKEVIKNIEE